MSKDPPRGQEHVVDLGVFREPFGERLGVADATDADHRLACESEFERVGDGDDLHETAVAELLHTVAHGGFGESDDLADGGVAAPTIGLQELDDLLRGCVQLCGYRVSHPPMMVTDLAVNRNIDDGNRSETWLQRVNPQRHR